MTTATRRPEDILKLHPHQIDLAHGETLEQAFNRLRADGVADILATAADWYDKSWQGARAVAEGTTLTIGQTLALYRVCQEQRIDDEYYEALDRLLETSVWHSDEVNASVKNDHRKAGRLGALNRQCPIPPYEM